MKKTEELYRICSCGRKIFRPFNSTIWPNDCVSCKTIKKNKEILANAGRNVSFKRTPIKVKSNGTTKKTTKAKSTKRVPLEKKITKCYNIKDSNNMQSIHKIKGQDMPQQ